MTYKNGIRKHKKTEPIESQSVYGLVLSIPPGKVATYGQIAMSLGNSRAGRGIGKILNKNPLPILVPCHRVVCSDGRVGGYMYGRERKISLLKGEGIPIVDGQIKDFEKYRY